MNFAVQDQQQRTEREGRGRNNHKRKGPQLLLVATRGSRDKRNYTKRTRRQFLPKKVRGTKSWEWRQETLAHYSSLSLSCDEWPHLSGDWTDWPLSERLNQVLAKLTCVLFALLSLLLSLLCRHRRPTDLDQLVHSKVTETRHRVNKRF